MNARMVRAIIEQVHEAHDSEKGASNHGCKKKPQEVAIVSVSHAIVQEYAMVIVVQDT